MEFNGETDPSFADIREYLNKFEGGAITLKKNHTTGIATMCLQHVQKKNAISGVMMVNLRDHILDLENWSEGKAIIVYGENNFCSGGDLDLATQSGNMKGAQYISTWMHDTLKRLQALPLVSVCLLSGPTLGGGAEFSVFCDYLIASSDVSFAFVHGKLDIVPAYGGGSRLVQRLGFQKGLDLLLTSRILKADECLSIGLAETIVPKETAFEDTLNWTMKKVFHHYTVVRAMKQIAYKASMESLEESLKFERKVFCPFWGSERNRLALKKKIKHL